MFTHQFSNQHTVSHTALSSLLTYTQPINAYRSTIRGIQSSKIDHGPITSEYDRQQQHKIMSKGLGLGLYRAGIHEVKFEYLRVLLPKIQTDFNLQLSFSIACALQTTPHLATDPSVPRSASLTLRNQVSAERLSCPN